MMLGCKRLWLMSIGLIILVFFLVACASTNAININAEHTDMAVVHDIEGVVTGVAPESTADSQYSSEIKNSDSSSPDEEPTDCQRCVHSNLSIMVNTEGNELAGDESKIADVLLCLIRAIVGFELRYPECPELLSFSNSIVEVEYVNAYIWREADRPNLTLLELEPEGITCFIRVPIMIGYRAEAYVFNLGLNVDDYYAVEFYDRYVIGCIDTMEDWIRNTTRGETVDSIIHRFRLHIPEIPT